jgi:ferredoxin
MDAVDRGKVGVVVRGCDSRAIVRLIVEQVINREDVYLIGVGCPGMLNRETDELLKKCAECRHHNPVIFDEMIGEESDATSELDRFYEIEETAAMPRGEREVYFDHIFAKCIRCYACRDVCPCCTCRQCFVDQSREGWIGKQNNIAENRFYGLTRVMHIADRCIECGECERVCPMNLPLMQLNRKVIHDIDELFNAEEAGLSLDEPFAALNTYSLDDVEEFM